ncbi:unnamed protein product [Acanthoscelides obtectus]|uniref:Protein tipE n=1 Tax=Acanthoscelides obtectus TaxID=200917 RepID=A0A9P0K0Q5_ACAOB|nr:unnamed protein product [Acanthoscelides obtectus]CAK1629030.1 Protein tipE [Acanthoscelides obtectus]
MVDEEKVEQQTWQQKLLFYTTAFFVLLGIFSLFSFLFLVPFVIDPAFTTIFMEFDEEPAYCVTSRVERRIGASNCSWTSCREGCTKDIYDCTHIYVNYKAANRSNVSLVDSVASMVLTTQLPFREKRFVPPPHEDYEDYYDLPEDDGYDWSFRGARLFPNVKGCGYPPMLNCTVFMKTYRDIGTNYSCYYSKVDPSLVISHLDMWQVYMNLVYAMAIPIPSFIVSVIYLAIAYFKIYNEDEEEAPLKKNAEAIDMEGETGTGETPVPPASGGITPASEAFREDLASFGHHFKVAMVDEMSRDSLADDVPAVFSSAKDIMEAQQREREKRANY